MFIVFGFIAVMAISMVFSISNIADQLKEFYDKQSILNEFETRLIRQSNTNDAISVKQEDYQISSMSAPRAAADLQKWINEAFRAYGGTVLSAEVLTPEPRKNSSRISLSMDFMIDEAALQSALHAIETNRPAIYIDELTLKPTSIADGGNAITKLQGNILVSVVWSSPSP